MLKNRLFIQIISNQFQKFRKIQFLKTLRFQIEILQFFSSFTRNDFRMKKINLFMILTSIFSLFFFLIHIWFKLGAISSKTSKSFTLNVVLGKQTLNNDGLFSVQRPCFTIFGDILSIFISKTSRFLKFFKEIIPSCKKYNFNLSLPVYIYYIIQTK